MLQFGLGPYPILSFIVRANFRTNRSMCSMTCVGRVSIKSYVRGQIPAEIACLAAYVGERKGRVIQRKRTAYSAALRLRGKDLNLRPLGYEPIKTLDALVVSTTHMVSISVYFGLFGTFCPRFAPAVP